MDVKTALIPPTHITHITHKHRAMGGSVDFKTALTNRLGVMQPSKANVDDFLAKHPHRVTKGV